MAPRRSRQPREAFLSHASAERELAGALVATLRSHGIPIWYSTTNIQGAQQWHDEIGRALRRCEWFILLLSPEAVRSRWVKRELLFALNSSHFEERIVPVLVRSCDWRALSWTLDALQLIDFRQGFEQGCRALLAVWGLGLDAQRMTKPRPVRRR